MIKLIESYRVSIKYFFRFSPMAFLLIIGILSSANVNAQIPISAQVGVEMVAKGEISMVATPLQMMRGTYRQNGGGITWGEATQPDAKAIIFDPVHKKGIGLSIGEQMYFFGITDIYIPDKGASVQFISVINENNVIIVTLEAMPPSKYLVTIDTGPGGLIGYICS